uniref:CCHC-type domain-containing protein n=1 Tax=Rhodnius prolixus TaxID=13249 RepID=T1H9C0_RHOPR
MSKLGDYQAIAANISNAALSTIVSFHKFIFSEEGNRNKRKRIKEFTGFNFLKDSESYKDKFSWIKENLKISELYKICALLNLECEDDFDDMTITLLDCLIDLALLAPKKKVEEDSDSEHEETEAEGKSYNEYVDAEVTTTKKEKANKFVMSFRDVQDSIRSFSGENDYSIEAWASDFEELSDIMEWSDIQKLVFAKRSLTGLAKLFVQSEKGLCTFNKLKAALLEEFSHRISSADLHRLLSERRAKKNESLQQYYFTMREMASRGSVEPKALIQYIVDGIPDAVNNKITLYEAKSLKELKDKIIIYESIREKLENKQKPSALTFKTEGSKASKFTQNNKCYNCNGEGHRAAECPRPRRERGSCYTCGEKGHLQNSCPNRKRSAGTSVAASTSKVVGIVAEKPPLPPYYTSLVIDGSRVQSEVEAVIDSGSCISLIRMTWWSLTEF